MWNISVCRFLLLVFIAFLACSPGKLPLPNPDTLPYKLEQVVELGGEASCVDLDGDGRDEIVYKRDFDPPGLGHILLRTQDGSTIEQVNFAGRIRDLHDFDRDGRIEILAQTSAPNNGAVAGGFDDRHSYLSAFSLNPSPEVKWWKETGGPWTSPQLFYEDFDGNGRRELLAFVWTHSAHAEQAGMEMIEPGTWHIYWQRPLNEPLQGPCVSDIDRDARPEILAIRPQGDLWVFDENFDSVQRRQIVAQLNSLDIIPDVDGDGIDEIIAGNPDGALLLGPNLNVKAVFPEGAIVGVMRRGLGTSPYILARRGDRTFAMQLVENQFFLFKRYGPAALWILAAGLIGTIGMVIFSLHRNHRMLKGVQALAFDTDHRGLLLLDADQRVQMMNTTLRNWLGFGSHHRRQRKNLKETLESVPALSSFLLEATILPAHHREAIFSLKLL